MVAPVNRLRDIFGRGLPARLERRLALTRLVMLTERLWAALWGPAMTAGLFALCVMTGLFALLPPWPRLAALALFAAAFLWSCLPLLSLRLPGRAAAMARIERACGLAHHPLSAWTDTLAAPAGDPRAEALWRAHRRRLLARLKTLKTPPPRSPLPERDPFALRNALALALFAALLLGGARDFLPDLRRTFAALPPAAGETPLDAWLNPPAYTGRPPVVLASGGKVSVPAEREIIVPQGSRLVLRLAGGRAPALEFYALETSGRAGKRLSAAALEAVPGEKAFRLEQALERPVVAVVRDGSELARWRFAVLPDSPPRAKAACPPRRTASGALVLDWEARDDYGVAALTAEIALAPRPAAGQLPDRPPLRFAPPRFAVPLPALNPKKASGAHTHDLSAHPWAGMKVVLRLTATDQAGQKGVSPPCVFRLPERRFTKPLARALIEQRRELILRPYAARDIATVLAAFLAWPEGGAEDAGVYLGLRHAAFRLREERTDAGLKDLAALLWELAVNIEDGDLADAKKALEAARRALEKALENGASEEEIARLTARLREAMNRYLRAMARRMRREDARRAQAGAGRQVTPEELEKMLGRVEDLARTGSREAARRMLAELSELLNNLQAQSGRAGPPTAGERALNDLQELMRRQQKLMDETWRARPPARAEGRKSPRRRAERDPRSAPGQGSGDERTKGGAGGKMEDLARRQEDLQKQLEALRRRMENQGLRAPGGLRKSGRAMGDAAGALGGGRRGEALRKQGEALEALRRGAQSLARRIARAGRGAGRFGAGRSDTDPLGRPVRHYGESYGPDREILPSESAVERARRILEALRKRANRHDRPRRELDYIERLLRGLY